jgi:hypothetical protein
MPPRSDSALQGLIDLANAGDAAAWDELLAHACERLDGAIGDREVLELLIRRPWDEDPTPPRAA